MTIALTDLVLLDTSLWIEYFRKKNPFFQRIEEMIEGNQVCTTNFIVAELLQGARSDEEFSTLQEATSIFHLLEEQPTTWQEAARLSYQIRQRHQSVGLGDCYIATIAYQHQVILWSLDKHFKTIQAHLKIKLASL